MIMYTDDTTLFCDINGNPADEHLLNAELCKITDWLSANKISQSMVTNQNGLSAYLGFLLHFHKSQIYTLCNYT